MSEQSTYPHSLASLSTREAITDAVHRALLGCDRNDAAIFTSAWVGEDVTFEVNDGEKKVIPSLSTIFTAVFDRIGPMDTSHSLANVRVDVQDGADVAHLTGTSTAQHCPPGRGREPDGPKFCVGSQYDIHLLKDEASGMWKIKKWVLNVTWTQGDPSVMQSMRPV
ncbi:hypothetical protein QBC34DRAFT_451854 [Podospora aff. communis PSN243]|uniref:SnoaL-like domain-containing protein n=1 Tax=Podospora aff. communis PSN243 TaxID=3040156 RepID=A0AAV9G702_9PEZI|nr:hypothetical protein QBC34DRAFT_451854 [Podospora aff. communis PSN243]